MKNEHPAQSGLIGWLKSSSFKCVLMDIAAFLIILVLFFLVCVPKKYNLSVGSISHDTINAPKDVVDEIRTHPRCAPGNHSPAGRG